MKIEIEVSEKRIKDLLNGHILTHHVAPHWKSISGDPFGKNGAVVRYDDPQKDEGTYTGRKVIRKHDVKVGLEKMATNNAYQWSQFIKEDDDAVTCDVAWQFIVFGKEIYG